MVFDKLDVDDWRVYFHDVPHLWLTGDAWTQSFCGQFHHMRSFARDVSANTLPTYSFIEPQHVIPPWSSQHPSAGVSHGEKLIASVYETLASRPEVFEKSLLLVVYDEHGGFYDHVVPPGHPGWGNGYEGVQHVVLRPDDRGADSTGPDAGYDFTTLGPRVPAVVISPLIEKGSVFGWRSADAAKRATFDHTSILATVGAMTGVWVDSGSGARRDQPRAGDQSDHTASRLPRHGRLRRLGLSRRRHLAGGRVRRGRRRALRGFRKGARQGDPRAGHRPLSEADHALTWCPGVA